MPQAPSVALRKKSKRSITPEMIREAARAGDAAFAHYLKTGKLLTAR